MDAFDAQLNRLMADREILQAMKNIRNLALDGEEADRSEEAIRLYAFLAVRRKRSHRPSTREDWEERWARDTGKAWKSLKEFPDRIRKISAQVKGVHGSAYFNPERAIRGGLVGWADFSSLVFSGKDDDFVDFAKRQFDLLPATLNAYATWLEVQIKGVSALMKHFYCNAPRKHSRFIGFVSNEVKRITGQFRDRQVADLLNVADRLVNPKDQGNDDRFDEQTITLLRSRQKRKISKT